MSRVVTCNMSIVGIQRQLTTIATIRAITLFKHRQLLPLSHCRANQACDAPWLSLYSSIRCAAVARIRWLTAPPYDG